jgi:hypothetical protein
MIHGARLPALHELCYTPLISIARVYVEEYVPNSTSQVDIDAATDALARLLTQSCSYSEAADACLHHVNTTEPARRIQDIINIASGCRPELHPTAPKLSKRCRLWNSDEDVRLLAGLLRYGVGDWRSISDFVGNGKSPSQCSQRWTRALNPCLSKDQWTEEEDEELWDGVQTHGQHSWAKVARQVQSRSDVQCRYRYDLLKKMRKFPRHPKVCPEPLRLMETSSELLMAELMPPLIFRQQCHDIRHPDR